VNRVLGYVLNIIGILILMTIIDLYFYKFSDFLGVFLFILIIESTVAILRSVEEEVEY